MLYTWTKVALLSAALSGLCTPVLANTTATTGMSPQLAQASVVETFPVSPPASSSDFRLPGDASQNAPGGTAGAVARVALMLPLRSETLGKAAEAVRNGFMAAHAYEKTGIAVNVIETADAVPDMLSSYATAAAQHDIIVGPLSRSGAAAIAQSGSVSKPTITLTQPELAGDTTEGKPRNLLSVGLSIEEEARQAADWAIGSADPGTAYIVSTATAWQRRAAKAFAAEWQHQGRKSEIIEIPLTSGYLGAKGLAQLKQQMQSEKPALIFAALDANQALQLRLALGTQIPMYGTSQLNPYTQPMAGNEAAAEMDGVRLLDIPWQLQPDHPAVMVYPRPVVAADQKRSPDMERLYALGIDAYRITREIALQRTDFEIDGVTGKLTVRFGQSAPYFERIGQHAIYRDGGVAPEQR
ncbi:penicillin-binding protein activator [Noviherbaspirillum sp.]|uniref:penicillin-binding protein activator n=1 Tax=Noviherbaspirillum sp. TaxID=1926288 RepID=UPI002FE05FFC